MNAGECLKLAITLIKEHKLDEKGWIFNFDTANRRAGCCKYNTKEITLSLYYVMHNTEDRIKNTILHEIAHALTPGHHHDGYWKIKALEIGCDGERCYDDNVVMPKGKHVYQCINCKREISYHRTPRTIRACGKCCKDLNNGKFDARYLLTKV